eukprot:gene5034-5143_t
MPPPYCPTWLSTASSRTTCACTIVHLGLSFAIRAVACTNATRASKAAGDKLTVHQKGALNIYTTQGKKPVYVMLNNALRMDMRQFPDEFLGYLLLTLSAMNRAPFSPKATVYRGLSTSTRMNRQELARYADVYKKANKNSTPIVWRGFTSTTRDMSVIKDFIDNPSNPAGKGGAYIMFVIDVYDGRLVQGFSDYVAENEVLLAPLSSFAVDAVLDVPEGYIIKLIQKMPSEDLLAIKSI